MDARPLIHYCTIQFAPGNTGLLKADFNNNQATRKRKLDVFYQTEVGILEVLQNNLLKAKRPLWRN